MTSQPGKTNNYNTRIAKCLKKKRQPDNEVNIEFNMKNIFLQKSYTKCVGEGSPDPFIKNRIENTFGSTVWYVIQFFYYMSK